MFMFLLLRFGCWASEWLGEALGVVEEESSEVVGGTFWLESSEDALLCAGKPGTALLFI